MHHKLIASLVLLATCPIAFSSDVQRQDQLVWDYAEFVTAFSTRDWPRLARFVSTETKVGFGGEMGMDGIMQVFGEDSDCHESMSHALEMGCRKVGDGENMRCLSPPQQGPDVVYLGARASFVFDVDAEVWTAEFLICGGD
jgi:hypothetical protein